MNPSRFANIILIIVLSIITLTLIILKHHHDLAVKKDLDHIEWVQKKVQIDHRENVRIKCGIRESELMTVAWEMIDKCIDERKTQ
jgi:hypothetical protein